MSSIAVLLTRIGFLCVGLALLTASATAQTAKIVKLVGSGSATVTIAGVSQPAKEGAELPLNAEIATSAGSEVYVEVIPGVVSSIKPGSAVRIDTLQGEEPALELRQGAVVTEIDKTRVAGKTYKVKTPRGVAAARGTAFSVSVTASGFSVTATADRVSFTTPSGYSVTIQAGMILISPPGATAVPAPIPLASAVASNPEIAQIVSDAVSTVATVVQNNLGQISGDSATNLVSQVLAVAVTAMPSQASAFTARAVEAVTASGAATSTTPEAAASAAGAVTAAAVQASPDQAAQIAGAAAQAAPTQSGIITAVAQQLAPQSKDAIAQTVANSTGQSVNAVQTGAAASATQATTAVNAAKDATSNVVGPPSNVPSQPPADGGNSVTTPTIPEVDVSVVSRSS